jgi:hypothetical protein
MQHKVPQARLDEPILDRRQSPSTFRVVVTRVMVKAGAMTHVGSLQSGIPVLSE